MRTRLVVALALLGSACGRGDRGSAASGASTLPSTGPEPVVVRMPRAGGVVHAFRYANLDSLVWRSSQSAPPVERVLAFDEENGTLAYLASDGMAGWVDLRVGSVRKGGKQRLGAIASGDGYAIFGVTDRNALLRLTPTGDWKTSSSRPIRRLFPLRDGTLLVLVDDGDGSVLLRMRPPDERIVDSLALPRPARAVATPIGDRVYFGANSELFGVRTQEMANPERLEADDEILAIAPTPSGDRVFVANKGGPGLQIVDRYAESIKSSIELPGLVTDLRMDPMGRFLLARPVQGDSAWVVDIGTQQLVGTVSTVWRADLPWVAVDGLVATAGGDDVAFVEANSGKTVRRVAGGAADLWFFTSWNGFRARAASLDTPVSFAVRDASRRARDTASSADSGARDSTPAATDSLRSTTTVVAPPATEPPPTPPRREAWTVSFAAVLSETRAREIAEAISVDGKHPRVVAAQTDGTTVYRVVLGPFASQNEAERLGRESKHNYWVYEGTP